MKSNLIFCPIFFDAQITNLDLLVKSIMAFIAFSMLASSAYIINDYQDIDMDRQHVKKKHRPLASGAISKKSSLLPMLRRIGPILPRSTPNENVLELIL